MNKKTLITERGCGLGLMVLLAIGIVFAAGHVQAADSVTLNFKYTVVQGTCDIAVNNNTNSITVPDMVFPGNMQPDYHGYTSQGLDTGFSFDVKLTGCKGGAGSKKPGIRITGNHVLSDQNPSNMDMGVLFRDKDSTATGVGFVIYSKQTPPLKNNYVSDVNGPWITNIDKIDKDNLANGAPLNSDKTITLSTNVSRGNQTSEVKAGLLKATIIFIFDYY